MIKSCSLILAFIMSCFINMYSQTVNGAMPSLTLVNKTTFDSAKVQIFYEFSYLQDSTDIAKRINGQTMLTIGKHICGFCEKMILLMMLIINKDVHLLNTSQQLCH